MPPRRRDYAAEYARRQAKARKLGFSSYYERRTRLRPGQARPDASELRERRGHASKADLERDLRSGRIVTMFQEPVGERNARGQYREVRVTVMLANGEQRSYRLRGRQLAAPELRSLQQAAVAGGADVYANPSLDVLEIIHVDRDADELEFEDAA